MASRVEDLQHNDATSLRARWLSGVFLVGATALLGFDAIRIAAEWRLGAPLAIALLVAGWILADFFSGLVHWAADTWFSVETPWIGRRYLHPFRVHHVNPSDILARGFLDLNGDVAMLTLPLFAGAVLLPLTQASGQIAALLLVATAGWVLPTNQIHQWSHQAPPPRAVQVLQRLGLVLSRRAHAIHHRDPAGGHYCITSGRCNRALARVDFYRRCERLIQRTTGLIPREEGIDALS